MNNLRCPQCGLSHIKRNGYTHYGKQNYRCKDCDRQFVEDSQHIGKEWSFAISKENKQWVWIALDIATKQVLAFYVGDRSAASAQELWRRIPQVYRYHATFYTDGLADYKTVLPAKSHRV